MKRNILVVDDSESIREVVGMALEDAGYRSVKACDGEHCLQQLKESGPVDLIISDLNMPKLDGIGLVRSIRQMDAYRYTPILILTTESQDVKRQEAKNVGATGWIIKPFNKEKLIDIVKKLLR